MNTEKAYTIIQQFKKDNPYILREIGVHGIELRLNGEEPEIIILIENENAELNLEIPDKYNYKNSDNELREISVIKRIAPPFRACISQITIPLPDRNRVPEAGVEAGTQAQPQGAPEVGTAGWNLILDGIPVCLSNWHVLCPQGNSSQIGTQINIDGRNIATLFQFEPVPNRLLPTVWDFALAQYNNVDTMLAQFTSCDGGNRLPYPSKLSKNVVINSKNYYKVGARTGCSTGSLVGIGDYWIDYHSNNRVFFTQQLIFTDMSKAGDSGSVIVRGSDESVTGLLFAGNDKETLANPIYRVGWEFVGYLMAVDESKIPIFVTGTNLGLKMSLQSSSDPVAETSRVSSFQLSSGKTIIGWWDSRAPGNPPSDYIKTGNGASPFTSNVDYFIRTGSRNDPNGYAILDVSPHAVSGAESVIPIGFEFINSSFGTAPNYTPFQILFASLCKPNHPNAKFFRQVAIAEINNNFTQSWIIPPPPASITRLSGAERLLSYNGYKLFYFCYG